MSRFLNHYETLIHHLVDVLEDTYEGLDVDTQGEHLTLLCIPTGRLFLLTPHLVTQQAWLSSPISGSHQYAFDHIKSDWVSVRPPHEHLVDLLIQELGIVLKQEVTIPPLPQVNAS